MATIRRGGGGGSWDKGARAVFVLQQQQLPPQKLQSLPIETIAVIAISMQFEEAVAVPNTRTTQPGQA